MPGGAGHRDRYDGDRWHRDPMNGLRLLCSVVTDPGRCRSCEVTDRLDGLPPRERIVLDDLWRVAHAFDTALPGWLVLLPRRHVTAIADLTDAEAVALGTWQVRLSRALHAVTGCVKTYVVQFAEADGFAHVHFHLIPRMADQSHELRGPRIFGLLGVPEDRRVSEARRDDLARALVDHLATGQDG